MDERIISPIDTVCVYGSFGDYLFRITHLSDYNRAGQPVRVTEYEYPLGEIPAGSSCITQDRSLLYDPVQRLVAEIWNEGALAGTMVSNRYTLNGRDLMQVVKSGTGLSTNTFGFDSYGRMNAVTSGLATVAYTYQSGLDRLASTISKHNGSTVLTASRVWDSAGRLHSINDTAGSAAFTAHGYTYDSVNRRTKAVREDGSFWSYGYNDRDEVSSGKHYWDLGIPVSGQQFTYAYDNIGNRNSAASGGDTSGANLRTTTYTVNSLNQYTNVTTAGYEDILGVAIATNSVTVDGNSCDRKGEYFHREISVANSSNPLWQTTTVSCGGSSSNGGFVFPKNSQSLSYDEDGNLKFDGVWLYRWDSRNRLVEMVMTNGIVGIPTNYAKRLQFTNDFNGRRISKTVTTWSNVTTTTRFIYDGWNLMAELNDGGNALRTFVWGQDLSGTVDGAGGIGGLLVVRDVASATNHFAAFDGNGNVTGLVAQNGIESARYEYGPFGEMIRLTGYYATANPFRWSTKFTDEETGLTYYGLRYYSASLGRWVNRDPIEEEGGNNLYAFVRNNPLAYLDFLGAMGNTTDTGAAMDGAGYVESSEGAQAASFYHRVKNMVENFNDMQEFMNGVLDASSGDFTDLFQALYDVSRSQLAGNRADDVLEGHHVLPLGRGSDKFANMWKEAGIDPDKFKINMEKLIHRKMHGRGGGKWNKAWEMFQGMNANPSSLNDPRQPSHAWYQQE